MRLICFDIWSFSRDAVKHTVKQISNSFVAENYFIRGLININDASEINICIPQCIISTQGIFKFDSNCILFF